MSGLTRDQILGAQDITRVEVPVPEWGGSVFVRSLTGLERDAVDAGIAAANEAKTLLINARARFAAAYICDDTGAALFTDRDIDALGAKSAVALGRVCDAGNKLNKLEAGSVEDAAKN